MRCLVLVKPNSSQEKVLETSRTTTDLRIQLTVYLRAKPHDGEANTALIKILSKHFGVPKTSIKILRGIHSHQKLIEL